MFTLFKTRLRNGIAAVLIFAGLYMTSCEMGLGPTVDLEPPVLRITGIELPDGTEIPIELEGNKLVIGPGILVGPESVLKGDAWDNVAVEGILVEEIGIDNVVSNSWSNAVIDKKAADGWQNWSIVLDGIKKGERTIRITAYDRPKNIGPNSVKQLTLLVDTDPPFVESIKIERKPGIQVDLLSKARLETLDDSLFEYVDYFQNENFSIRAVIAHDFALSDVTLNFIDANGSELFSNGRSFNSGTVYSPKWDMSAQDFIAADSKYESGKHYLNVVISARAAAGHSGQNDVITNLLYNLCWYPESDKPKAHIAVQPDDEGVYIVEKDGILPVNVFDDDNVAEIYMAVVPANVWADYMPGLSGDQKLESLYDENTRAGFATNDTDLDALPSGLSPEEIQKETDKKFPFKKPAWIGEPTRNVIIPVETNSNQGASKLIVVAKDKKDDANTPGVWGHKIFDIHIMDEGIPLVSIMSPLPAPAVPPVLENNGETFTLKGRVRNMVAVDVIKVAWVPAGLPAGTNTSQAAATALSANNNNAEYEVGGVKVWNLPLDNSQPDVYLGGKLLKDQRFEKTFNVFEDFIYDGEIENKAKFFVIYTLSKGDNPIPVFEPFSMSSYTARPAIMVYSPIDDRDPNSTPFVEIEHDVPIPFTITVESPMGAPFGDEGVELWSTSETPNITVPLTRTGNENEWKATLPGLPFGNYSYSIRAVDKLGNGPTERGVYLNVTELPKLTGIATSYEDGAQFSARETRVSIQADFERPVTVTGSPKLILEGITNEGADVTRFAVYAKGSGSYRLNFEYAVQPNDLSDGLRITALDISEGGSGISANFADWGEGPVYTLLSPITDDFNNQELKVDGVAPVITAIAVTAVEARESAYTGWLIAGYEMDISLSISKPVKVLGTPQLKLPFTSGTANYNSLTDNDTTLVFRYKVQPGEQAAPADNPNVVIDPAACFAADDLEMIVDTVGTRGNYLKPGGSADTNPTQKVDAVPPGMLSLLIDAAPLEPQGRRFQVRTAAPYPAGTFPIETYSGTTVEYTTDGIEWKTLSAPYTFDVTEDGMHSVSVRQVDRAGNPGDASPPHLVTLPINVNLVAISCEDSNGAYKAGDTLTFNLIFNGEVTNNATGTSITISGGATNTGAAVTLPFGVQSTAASTLTATWQIPANSATLFFEPIIVSALNLGGVRREDASIPLNAISPVSNTATGNVNDYLNRHQIAVMTTPISVTQINGAAFGTAVNSTVISPAGGRSTITLTFNRPIWTENGIITVRPAGGWHIPPVLDNDVYSSIENTLSGTNLTVLQNNYTATTHGLITAGNYYVPDTATKYVLDYDLGISGAAGTVNNLRTAFQAAEYLYKKTEASSPQITGQGSDTITLSLDQLEDGRQWLIEIPAGAFIDRAGNKIAAWNSGNSYFWSQKTATPVIRVNRFSNDHPTNTPTTRVDYRIDCETPGAIIQHGVLNHFDAEVPTTTDKIINPGPGTDGRHPYYNTTIAKYRSRNVDGPQNSGFTMTSDSITYADDVNTAIGTFTGTTDINDADSTQLGAIGLSGNTSTVTGTIGNPNELYNARKDYIAARATRSSLDNSDRGYEGAFKTVIVYRNIQRGTDCWHTGYGYYYSWMDPGTTNDIDDDGPKYVKIEGANIQAASTTVSGFPLSNNEMDGTRSKYAYHNVFSATQNDWIWISWEIVCDFWQVGLVVPQTPLHGELTKDSWPFQEEWHWHSFRKYGNWGLKVGNQTYIESEPYHPNPSDVDEKGGNGYVIQQ